MPLPESGRNTYNKLRKNTMVKLGCSVRKDKADEFKISCALLGTIPNAVFKAAIEETISKAKKLRKNEGGYSPSFSFI